jgi:hypothetical protein
MKKISLLALLLVAGLMVGSGPALGGAYDDLLPDAVKGKPFVPSIKIRFEYDDNIYTTTDGEKAAYGVSEQSSWKFYIEPKIDLHYLTATTYLGLGYQFSWIYYEDRPEDDSDIAHDVLADVRHRFSPSIELAIRDAFRSSEEPEIAEQIVSAGGVRTIPYQRNGDYIINQLGIGLNVQTGRNLLWNFSYANLMVDFDEDEFVVDATGAARPGASYYYDRMVNTGAIVAQYIVTPETQIDIGGRYSDIDYDSDALMKDADDTLVYVGLSQDLSRTVVGKILAGWQKRDVSDVGVDENAPYVDASVASKIGKKGNGKLGYRYSLGDTQYAVYGVQRGHTLYGALNAWLMADTSLHIHTSYEMANLDSDFAIPGRTAAVDRDDDIWLLGIVVRHYVHRDIYLEAGYRLTDVDSDLANSSYDRNRFYLGCGGIF